MTSGNGGRRHRRPRRERGPEWASLAAIVIFAALYAALILLIKG